MSVPYVSYILKEATPTLTHMCVHVGGGGVHSHVYLWVDSDVWRLVFKTGSHVCLCCRLVLMCTCVTKKQWWRQMCWPTNQVSGHGQESVHVCVFVRLCMHGCRCGCVAIDGWYLVVYMHVPLREVIVILTSVFGHYIGPSTWGVHNYSSLSDLGVQLH